MSHPVTHFEVLGQDAARLQRFYADAFGWKLGEADPGDPLNYAMAYPAGDAGISGGIGRTPDGAGHVTFYVSVDDPAAALAEIERLGGRTVAGPQDLPSGGSFALFADPEGHVVGLVKEP